jgi:2-oxoglutarate dehydrogenase E2 component (dihydrolipoamide succinyltransferase)
VAQTLRHAPSLNSAVKGYRVLVPESVDVGVSVATGRSIAPVTVIQRAEQKSLREIHDELKAGAQRAIESERRESASGPPKWHRYARFAPNILRRGVIRGMANTPSIKRSKVGTVQITSIDLDDLEFYLPTHLGTATLISVGGTKLRPMVVNGQVEARPSAYIAFSVDQRVVTAVHSLRVFRRFKRLMQQPHRLESSVEKEAD